MKHIKDFAKRNFTQDSISFVVSGKCNENFDDMKYSFSKMKEKWNRFWGWVFGDDSETSKYNPWSNDFDSDALASELKSKKKEGLSYDIKWVKINSAYDKNMKKTSELINDSSEKSNKGFWRTKTMLQQHKKIYQYYFKLT